MYLPAPNRAAAIYTVESRYQSVLIEVIKMITTAVLFPFDATPEMCKVHQMQMLIEEFVFSCTPLRSAVHTVQCSVLCKECSVEIAVACEMFYF